MAPHVQDYAVRLTMATHPERRVRHRHDATSTSAGARSPRGAQAITLAAKVHALLDGRFNVSFEDVQQGGHRRRCATACC